MLIERPRNKKEVQDRKNIVARLNNLSNQPELQAIVGRGEREGFPSILTKVPINKINVLTQIRQTKDWDYIRALAEDIEISGLESPLLVARLDREHADRHVGIINLLWNANHKVDNLSWVQEGTEEIAYVLVAGEMRYWAHLRLIDQNKLPKDFAVEARVHFNSSPYRSLTRQIKENALRKDVPIMQEAKGVRDLFMLNLIIDPNFTLKDISQDVGRSTDTVSKMIRVVEHLPIQVHGLVEESAISYGIALMLLDLKKNHDVSDDDLVQLANEAAENEDKVADFKKRVEKYKQEINLEALFAELFTRDARRAARQKNQAERVSNGLYGALTWIERFYTIRNAKLNDIETDPMSLNENRRTFRKLLDALEVSLPSMIRELAPEERQRALILILTHSAIQQVMAARGDNETDSRINPFFTTNGKTALPTQREYQDRVLSASHGSSDLQFELPELPRELRAKIPKPSRESAEPIKRSGVDLVMD